jgi:hypothetical protein
VEREVNTRPTDGSPRALTRKQLDFYHDNGWLLVERALSADWLDRLRTATKKIVDSTRSMTESANGVNLWDGHTAENPCLYDVSSPEDTQETIWDFYSRSVLAEMVCDLLGPQVQYRYGVARFRELVPPDLWHQDMPFDDLDGEGVLAGVHLQDTEAKHPHLQVISGSHRGESFTHLDGNGEFIGALNEEEMPRALAQPAVDLLAPAGSIEFLDYRTLHQDMWGGTERGGTLLYAAYATRDARPRGEPRYPDVPSRRRGTILPAAKPA